MKGNGESRRRIVAEICRSGRSRGEKRMNERRGNAREKTQVKVYMQEKTQYIFKILQERIIMRQNYWEEKIL